MTVLERDRTLGPYRLVERVGRGGMGVVWKAIDMRLDRPVALKFLSEDHGRDPRSAELLDREARAIATLNHPNIVTLHALEEIEGNRVLAMEWVEGKTLDRLIPEGGLSLGTFYNMAGLLLGAVGAAHENGVVHGDIKPSNVVVSPDGRMKILDFGLARILCRTELLEGCADSDTITADDRIRGTMHYMSPEHLRALPLDERADLFSVGVVLYEMLLGRRPFVGDKPVDLISAILRDDPEPAHARCSDVPEPLAELLDRCLSKDPERRHGSARELADEIEAIRVGTKRDRALRSIAVLPFADMSPSRDQEHFCEGLAEEILNALASVEGLRVASRTSSFRFRSSDADSRSIGLQLGVMTLLEGSVRKAGDRLRVTVQLINASDGYQIWSERYDRDAEDVFEVQDEIARHVVDALEIALTPTERKALKKPKTRQLEAYEYYLRGRRFFYRLTRKNLEFGREMFERAIELDPEYALAYCGLADCYAFMYLWYEQATKHLEFAERASQKAVELGPELAEAHASRGLAFAWCDDCGDRAERHFETALRLNPRLFEAYYFFARDCFSRGRLEKAARLFERAAEVRPEDYQAALLLPQVYHALGRDRDAERAARRGLEISERHLQLNPDDQRALYLSSSRWLDVGDRRRALELAQRALDIDADEPTVLFNVACTFGRAGLVDRALDCLERAVTGGFGHRRWIEQDSDLDPLKDHPRFRALMDTL